MAAKGERALPYSFLRSCSLRGHPALCGAPKGCPVLTCPAAQPQPAGQPLHHLFDQLAEPWQGASPDKARPFTPPHGHPANTANSLRQQHEPAREQARQWIRIGARDTPSEELSCLCSSGFGSRQCSFQFKSLKNFASRFLGKLSRLVLP